tara:strand:+ start:38 stop:454 length:417 start_codon:yes stop_codon:yes gene_type:complete
MTRARNVSKLGNPNTFTIDSSNNVGLNSTSPDAKLDVIGVVSATSYYGDGSNLSNIISGVGINSAGTNIGYGITTLNFVGSGTTIIVDGTTADISAGGAGGEGNITIVTRSGTAVTFATEDSTLSILQRTGSSVDIPV